MSLITLDVDDELLVVLPASYKDSSNRPLTLTEVEWTSDSNIITVNRDASVPAGPETAVVIRSNVPVTVRVTYIVHTVTTVSPAGVTGRTNGQLDIKFTTPPTDPVLPDPTTTVRPKTIRY